MHAIAAPAGAAAKLLREVDLYTGSEPVTNRYACGWIGRSQREL